MTRHIPGMLIAFFRSPAGTQIRINRTAWQVIACVTALLLFPTSSGAQTPATSFDDLRQILRPGEEVIVTHADGRRTRERVLAVRESSLEMQSKSLFRFRALGPPKSYAESSVSKVERVDPPWQGMALGFAVGFVPIAVADVHRTTSLVAAVSLVF